MEIRAKIQLAREKLKKSSFYTDVIKQVQDPKFVELIERVIGTDPNHSQLQVVLYGVGSMDSDEGNRLQLCLPLLLREKFPWVNDIVVYDPLLSAADQKAINDMGCTCLSVNEKCRRTVDRPTLFFMPHCSIWLMCHVLEANWTLANLNKIIILGNSFQHYKKKENFLSTFAAKMKAILDTDHLFHEIPLPGIADENPDAFRNLSWHFFDWDGSLHRFTAQETSGSR